MPSSRKRNKGKERKAKAAKEAQFVRETVHKIWRDWVNGKDDDGKLVIHCNHGYNDNDILPDKSHPVSFFIDSYHTNGDLKDTLMKHEEVQNSDTYRKLALDIFTRIGVNWILRGEDYNMIIECATNILLLESYDETGDYDLTINRRVTAQKLRDFLPLLEYGEEP